MSEVQRLNSEIGKCREAILVSQQVVMREFEKLAGQPHIDMREQAAAQAVVHDHQSLIAATFTVMISTRRLLTYAVDEGMDSDVG